MAAGGAATGSRRHSPRSLVAVLVLVVIATATTITVWRRLSDASHSSTLTVVGTSDVSDSDLVQSVLKPDFEAANPRYTLNYVSEGSGAAIATAESGAASVLLVHAASLENQFVQQGYSGERYGRAIFYGDYVLLGPSSDPAGVLTNAPHDIVTAVERIARAGRAGEANFVSRGGTPGTTVEEHQIWSLAAGVPHCTVGATDGGGVSPSTAGGACPPTISYPSWYHSTGLDQGPNVENADVCNYPHANCYALTDRGTYQYLLSTGAVSNLKIVTRDNASSARGGKTLLINSFHAYAVNPARFSGHPSVQINLTAAKAFLGWVTSPAGQAAVGAYMSKGGDPPFLPDAAPALTASAVPTSVADGGGITVTGSLRNIVPGTPPLVGVKVTLSEVPTSDPQATPRAVATSSTTGDGRFTLHYRPTSTATYTVSSGPISQIENATLHPVFGDLLHAASQRLGRTDVPGP